MARETSTASAKLNIQHKTDLLERDKSKVICRIFMHGGDPARIKRSIQQIVDLDDDEVEALLTNILEDFSERHRNLEKTFRRHFKEINMYIESVDYSFKEARELLIGAYYTMEYAVESAALFNPSIVPHPDQTGVPEGCRRFVMSLRAVGEGHISSLVFRSGIIHEDGELEFDPSSSYVNQPEVENPKYKKAFFDTNMEVFDGDNEVVNHILEQLSDKFSYDDLKSEMSKLSDEPKFSHEDQIKGFNQMHHLADSNYQLRFDQTSELSERVIYPVSEEEEGGMEDARFVQFQEEDGSITYYGTYTAYDGSNIIPQLIETKDFTHFKMRTMYGKAAKDKDMALFPRKINGQYVMLSRQDAVNIHIMFSENIRQWKKAEILLRPTEPWEFVQMGACAPPIETPQGWLVIIHGVGPMRAYSLGAILLDIDDPSRVIKRLKKPLIKALEHQLIGYVPNVVYTCGAIVHNEQLVIPYALSDIKPAVAQIALDELLDAMAPV